MKKYEMPEMTIISYDTDIQASENLSSTDPGTTGQPAAYTTALTRARGRAAVVTQQIIVFQE